MNEHVLIRRSVWDRHLRIDTQKRCIYDEDEKKMYFLYSTDFGCDACTEQGLCRTGHHGVSFCGVFKALGIEIIGNCWDYADTVEGDMKHQ